MMDEKRQGRAYRAGYALGYWFGGPALTVLLILVVITIGQAFAEAAH